MVVASVILLSAILAAAVLSLHLGPHGLVASGVVGMLASLVLIADVVFLARTASQGLILGFLLTTVIISIAFLAFGVRTIKKSKVLTSANLATRLLDSNGVALTDLTPLGTVKVLGETWSAESLSGVVKAGVEVYVSEMDGLKLKVWANPQLSQNAEQENKA